jgi:hypothetical protein
MKHGLKTKTAKELAVMVNLKSGLERDVASTQLLRVLMIRVFGGISRAGF